ncbi:hypothetical protein PRZ48_008867 [Zasmidium cellare]|uniref:BTB domain-containing protein n=1 Tax=Zasmidium cellare TaxID=395010 RepID=A0ABR0EHX9_ZASCE|nr:hypothetical protein PRZ48_008867 [Zasmidium cellare]
MAPAKNTILVHIQRPGQDEHKRLSCIVPREKLVQHSAEFAAFLPSWPVADESRRSVILPQGSPSALQHVLRIIRDHSNRQQLYISLKDLSIPQKLAVWNACQILDLRPKRALEAVDKHLGWVISHAKTTPEIMRATYDCAVMFRDSDDYEQRKIWNSMIHQYVWDLIHGKFSKEEQEALVKTYTPLPELFDAIEAKYEELKGKNVVFEQNRSENHTRRANRRVRRSYERREAARERIIEQVVAGVRPMTADVREAVLARQRVPS